MGQSTIRVNPDIREWDKIRRWIDAFSIRHRIGRDICLKLHLAAEEWFINVVRHGFAGVTDSGFREPLIQLSLEWIHSAEGAGGAGRNGAGDGNGASMGDVILRLVDNAPAYNPLEREDPDISLPVEHRPIGGLGIYLIKQLMDHCHYERRDGCNRLTLRKQTMGTGFHAKE